MKYFDTYFCHYTLCTSVYVRVTQHTFALCHNISESTETESDNRQFAQSDCDHCADKTNQEENKHTSRR